MSDLRSRDIVGKTVAAVAFERLPSDSHGRHVALERITFTDGSRIVFLPRDTDTEGYVFALYIQPDRRGPRNPTLRSVPQLCRPALSSYRQNAEGESHTAEECEAALHQALLELEQALRA